ncbi:protein-glutamate methylesterase/protein-glutamine glutaminase [Lacrimispora celerecrescens]|uniref:Protein-glutamate methylesterase/protein-glutamine glutaminase n=1 Tax=[Clostridium] celerecrescens 18A TaxID=1286362 RepID=A0A2M8Z1T7_9FIRM|nr:chemotaxis response regulator protein-glutamate methylesterase [Lacrimispora celerecrescens]PJJ27409.1 two-component system chemotaxis response regulator CheB [[Clostridium] celerecrescens 18A]
MENRKKIRVLIVDDSMMSREVIRRGISSDPLIEVVALAGDPFEARDKILKFHPDVITCDVEMPRMNGIEFVRRLLPQYFVPIVMVTTVSDAVFEAMEAGAIDFVAKPDIQSPKGVEEFICDLVKRIKTASTVKNALPEKENVTLKVPGNMILGVDNIIAIGASTGGTEAIYSILRSLPPTIPGIVIAQHIPPVFSKMFAERLDTQTSLKVKEAETGDYVDQGTVLIAPGDRHMRIKRVGRRYQVECFYGDKVNGHCPSVDVLFESVAKEASGSAVGILLTGMGHDGAKGLLAMRCKGYRTIGQDEASSIVYGMPKVAFDIGAVEIQAALGCIPQVLLNLIS